jgi:hypothetical protein
MEKWMVTVGALNMRTEPIISDATIIQPLLLGSFFWGVYDPSNGWVKATHYQKAGDEFATVSDFYISGSTQYTAKQVYADPPLAPVADELTASITFKADGTVVGSWTKV